MGRQVKSWADERGGCYYVRLGEVDAKTGKRRPVMLKDERGNKVRLGDEEGRVKALARLLEAREHTERRAAGPSVGDLVYAYLKWHEAQKSKPKTIETHKWHLTKFAEFEHGGVPYDFRPAAEIDVIDLTRYRKHMEARGAQTGYVKLAYASVLACWRWAGRPVEDREPLRLLDKNPFVELKRPKKGRGKRLVVPWPVIQEVIAFAEQRNERMVDPDAHRNKKVAMNRERARDRLKCVALRLIAESGARPHEAAELRWDWTYEAERVLIIPAEHTKTGKEDRIIGLSPESAKLLAELRASRKAHATWVFATANEQRDEPPSSHKLAEWFRGLRRNAAKAGIAISDKITLVTLRHSFVSQARAGGIGLRELSPGMGHSAEVAEDVYAHAQIHEIRDLMDRARAARAKGASVSPPPPSAP